MKILNRLAVLGLVGSVAAACSSIDLDSTKQMALKGDGFQKALFNEYVDLARSEDDQGDSRSAVFYNDRAKMVADGKSVDPTEMSARKLPKGTVADLTAARKRLTDALAGGLAKKDPKKAAHAQAMFDCWMEQQEENDQPDHIAVCRSAFEKAMGGKPAAKKAKADREFIIYFGFDKSNMDEAAMAVAYEVMAATVGGVNSVVLTGHADTAGDKGYNKKLSEKRVNAVKQTFSEIGIDPSAISTQFSGEDDPAENTGDGVENAKNRRVTVVLKF